MENKKKKHITVKKGKIVSASKEAKIALSLFYLTFKVDPIMRLIAPRGFKTGMIENVTLMLKEIGLDWNDIPDDPNDWGCVLDFINEIKEGIRNDNGKQLQELSKTIKETESRSRTA